MDLSNLSISELKNLQGQIAQEITRKQGVEVSKAREQILAIAQSVGMPLKELIGKAPKVSKAGGTVAVRFRDPADASHQWTGRGRQPKWVKEWVEGGKSLNDLRV